MTSFTREHDIILITHVEQCKEKMEINIAIFWDKIRQKPDELLIPFTKVQNS